MTPKLKISKNADGTLNIGGLQIWSAVSGVKGYGSPPEGDTFTESDLDEMVRAHSEVGNELRPRIYAGHPLNPTLKMLARPQGKISKLYRDGKYLLADLTGVNSNFWTKAQQDGARLSPDVKLGHRDQRTGKQYPLSVVGVGVLGAVPPANQLLSPLDGYDVVTHYADAAQQRAYNDGSEIRSYTGFQLPVLNDTTAPTPLVAVLDALRQYTATEDSNYE